MLNFSFSDHHYYCSKQIKEDCGKIKSVLFNKDYPNNTKVEGTKVIDYASNNKCHMDGLFGLVFYLSAANVLRFILLERHRRHLGRVSFAFEGTAEQAKGAYSTLPTQQTSLKIMPLEMFAPAQFLISMLGPCSVDREPHA